MVLTSQHKARQSDGQGAQEKPESGTAEPALPLLVVERSAEGVSSMPSERKLDRVLRLIPILPVVLVSVALGGIVGLYFQPPGLQKAMEILGLVPGAGTTSPIAVPLEMAPEGQGALGATTSGKVLPDTVIGLGTLLPDGDVITIAPPFGAGDARIAEIRVEEGERIVQGQLLAVLDNRHQLEAAAKAAEAEVGVREASLQQARSSTRASLEEARAALARAEATAVNAQRDFERALVLLERKAIPEATLDQRRAAKDEARRDVEQARATLSRYETGDIDSQVDVVVAARNLEAARAELERAISDQDEATIRAPIAGTVLTIHLRPGEKPGSEGVMNIGNIDRMTAEVDIYQSQIGTVSLGDAVEILAEALPRPLHGKVSKIGLEVNRQSRIDDDPAANTDARVVEVTVLLDEASSTTASRYTNLKVTARIAVGTEP